MSRSRVARVFSGLAVASIGVAPLVHADSHYHERRTEQAAVSCDAQYGGFEQPCAQFEPYSLESPQTVQPDEAHQAIWEVMDALASALLIGAGVRLMVRRPEEF